MKQVTKKSDITFKSRHFAHKGASSHGFKLTESSQNLKTQVPQDVKSNAHGTLPFGKDFSDEKKLVMQQMASKEKQKEASLDNAQVMSRTNDNGNSEKAESSSAPANAEIDKVQGNPSSLVKSVVYSSAEIKPRNSTLQGASVNLSRTGSQTEERTNVAESDKSSVVEEDSRMKIKSGAPSHTSHLVAANYSFFPGSEEPEFEQPKNAKVRKVFNCKIIKSGYSF